MSNEEGTPPEDNQPNQNDPNKPVQPTNNGPVIPPSFQPNPSFNQFGGMAEQNLPNSTIALIFGILSIPACCCYGLGLVFGIIAWILAGKDIKQYKLNFGAYSISSYKNAKAGKICGIIGVVLSALYIIACVALISYFGWAVLRDPDMIKEILKNKEA